MKKASDKTATPRSRSYLKFILILWGTLVLGLGTFSLLIYTISAGIFGDLPTFEELENPQSLLASELYTSDQKLLGKYFFQNRSNASYEEISPNMIHALLATEDIRFYEHSGIDLYGVASIVYYLMQGKKKGASTITQQLAKNLFPREDHNIIGLIVIKFKEWITAVKLEKRYTKKEILTMYLNTVPFGNNAWGIKSASRTFFNKPPDSLKIEEAAMLVGMLKATTLYNPVRNPKNAKTRRNVVLSQMYKYDYIKTQEEKDSLQNLDIVLDFKRADHHEGLAPYFREQLRLYLMHWCRNNKKIDGTQYNLYRDGLKIYTTIHSKMQEYAEEAVVEHMTKLQGEFFEHWEGKKRAPFDWHLSDKQIENLMNQAVRRSARYKQLKDKGMPEDSIKMVFNTKIPMKVFSWEGPIDTVFSPLDSILYYKHFLQTGFCVIEPQTGFVRAWVGGNNHRYFQYDHVNRNAKRQVGSTFKPFVYTLAVEEGWSPCLEMPNNPITFEKGLYGIQKSWTPKNSGKEEYGEMMTLFDGLGNSVNTMTARVMYDFGPQNVLNLIDKMGIDTTGIEPFPSICLGTPDISVLEMVGAYSTFVNRGFHSKPMVVSRIEDKNGAVLEEFTTQNVEVVDEQTAYVMLQMLKHVVNRGTGVGLRFRYKLYGEIAGKTGTTQNHSDGWFMGMTPQLVAGCWVGAEDRSVHFRSLLQGQGAYMAMPIFAKFMQKVYADKSLGIDPNAHFPKPTKPLTIELDCSEYKKQKKKPGEGGFGGEWEKEG